MLMNKCRNGERIAFLQSNELKQKGPHLVVDWERTTSSMNGKAMQNVAAMRMERQKRFLYLRHLKCVTTHYFVLLRWKTCGN